jgi:hypothetical protein
MTKVIPTEERILRARKLIQKARDYPLPDDLGWQDFAYAAQIKDIMRQAHDLVKFVPMITGVTPTLKEEAKQVITEIQTAEKEILHRSLG